MHTHRIVKEYKKDLLKHFSRAEQKEMKWNWIDFVWKKEENIPSRKWMSIECKVGENLLVDNLSRAFCIVSFSWKILLFKVALNEKEKGNWIWRVYRKRKKGRQFEKESGNFLWPFVNYFSALCVSYLRDKHK